MTTANLPFNPKVDTVKAFRATITPQAAEYLLEHHNPINRPLRPGVAERYGREMKAGGWMINNEGMGFDRSGALVDGQHRLYACVDAGVPFDTLIVVGLDPGARETVNVGLKRTLADRVGFRTGERVSSLFAAIGRCMIDPMNLGRSKTDQDLIQFLQDNAVAIAFVESAIKSKMRGVTQATVLAPIARAYTYEDHDALASFIQVITTGHPDPERAAGSASAITFRNMLLRETPGKRMRGEMVYAKSARALRAFLDNVQLPKIYEASQDYWPIVVKRAKRK